MKMGFEVIGCYLNGKGLDQYWGFNQCRQEHQKDDCIRFRNG